MQWAAQSPQPLIVLMDEVDSLVGDTLISLLRQLRSGYDQRPDHFPQSVILCGVRDVRDYRLHTDGGKTVITGGSAFNIKAESLRLGNFVRDEIEELYRQHTDETRQIFLPDALEAAWHLTQGQPWLVNALAYEVCFKWPPVRDCSQPVSAAMIQEAKERLILRRETHLDQLSDKLKEARVSRVISPILQGRDLDQTVQPDDIEYTLDLGLITRTSMGLQISNPIYREVIPRELTWITQLNFESTIQPLWYIAQDGSLDMEKLLTAFQQFFRENSAHWVERFDYKEAGPQLLLQAFLQRILNSGGRIEREYGLGRQRTDLLVIWPYGDQAQRVVLELKIQHTSLERTLNQGLEQTWRYMDTCGTRQTGISLSSTATPRFPGTTKSSAAKPITKGIASLSGECNAQRLLKTNTVLHAPMLPVVFHRQVAALLIEPDGLHLFPPDCWREPAILHQARFPVAAGFPQCLTRIHDR